MGKFMEVMVKIGIIFVIPFFLIVLGTIGYSFWNLLYSLLNPLVWTFDNVLKGAFISFIVGMIFIIMGVILDD